MNKQRNTFGTFGDLFKNAALSRIKPSSSRLFDRYVMVDYSGAQSHSTQKKAIFIANLDANSTVDLVLTLNGFTRDTLRENIISILRESTKRGERVLFGIDHQFSWPQSMLELCCLHKSSWREAIQSLSSGAYGGPALEHPSQFCSKFNSWVQSKTHNFSGPFYSPIHGRAKNYNLPTLSTFFKSDTCFRITERFLKALGLSPKSAFTIGDNGAVGGQTICGMIQLATLFKELDAERIKVACWPYDGLSIQDNNYLGKHVLLEIYPTLLRPMFVQQTDENDARESAVYCWYNDKHGKLSSIMDLTFLESHKNNIFNEGWILGCLQNYENFIPHSFESNSVNV